MSTDYSLGWIDEPRSACTSCGGGMDGANARVCLACDYEQRTGRKFERDCDAHIITVENGRIVRLRKP